MLSMKRQSVWFFGLLMLWAAYSGTVVSGELNEKAREFPPIQVEFDEAMPSAHLQSSAPPGVVLVPNDRGQFTLRRASDSKWLLYPNAGTTYLSVNVDGNIYTNGSDDGGLSVASRTGNVWAYNTVNGVRITQTLVVEGNALKCEVQATNVSGGSRSVQARYLFDTQVDDNDGAPLYAAGNHYTYETQFVPPTFAEWRSWRRPDDQSVIGVGTLERSASTKVVFAWWPQAVGASWSYTADPSQRFYTPGYTTSSESDSCVLVYLNLGTLTPGTSRAANTWYGIGSPTVLPANRLEPIAEVVRALRDELIAMCSSDEHRLATILAYGYKAMKEDPAAAEGLLGFFKYGNPALNVGGLLAGMNYVEPVTGLATTGIGVAMKAYIDSLNDDVRLKFDTFYGNLLAAQNLNPNMDPSTLAPKIKELLQNQDPFKYGERMLAIEGLLTSLESFVASRGDDPRLSDAVIAQSAANIRRIVSDIQQSSTQTTVVKWYCPSDETFVFSETGAVARSVGQVTSLYADMQQSAQALATTAGWFGAGAFAAGVGKVIVFVALTTTTGVGGVIEAAVTATGIGLGAGAMVTDVTAHAVEVQASRMIAVYCIFNGDFALQALRHSTQIAQDTDEYIRSLIGDPPSLPLSGVNILSASFDDVIVADGDSAGHARANVTFTTNGPITAKTKLYAEIRASQGSGRPVVTVANPDPMALSPGTHNRGFDFSAIEPGAIGSGCFTYTGETWVSYGTAIVKSDPAYFAVGTAAACRLAGATTITTVGEATIVAGGTHSEPLNVSSGTARLELGLYYPGSDLDLHLYDPLGRHTGMNYLTGEMELQIPGSTHSGSATLPEVIVLAEPPSGGYVAEVVGITTAAEGEPFTVQALMTPESGVLQPVEVSAVTECVGYDRQAGRVNVRVSITNTSGITFEPPIHLIIEGTSAPGVSLSGPDGVTSEGKLYVDVSSLLRDVKFRPSDVLTTEIRFNNPDGIRFTFQPSVRGVVSSQEQLEAATTLQGVLRQWLGSDSSLDVAPAGGDGIVNFLDFAALAGRWIDD